MVGFKRNGPGAGSWGSNGRKFRKWDGLETEERRSNKELTSFFPVCFFGELFSGSTKGGKSEIFLDVGRRDGKGSRSGQIDLKAETNSVFSFRRSD